jgi:flavorubredoxin
MRKLIILLFLLINNLTYSNSIIIGDSQVPYIDMNTNKAHAEKSLWKVGKDVNWLRKSVKKHRINTSVRNVILCIGTNDLYRKSDFIIEDLFKTIKRTFPNAKIIVVQGSWGWGYLKKTKEKKVRNYYKKFVELGGILIETPIGKTDPHGNRPVYKKIGKEIDNLIN